MNEREHLENRIADLEEEVRMMEDSLRQRNVDLQVMYDERDALPKETV